METSHDSEEVAPVRPGSGGRIPPSNAFQQTAATAALYEELGPPEVSHHKGATMLLFREDPDGDGINCVRLSARDVQGGETAMTQVHPLRDLNKRLELKPRLTVVTVNNSGARRYEERPDLVLIEREILAGNVRWVAWREPDRIAREELPFYTFTDLLKRTQTKLYLGSLGREVDWTNDRYQLNIQNAAAADERQRIYLRTHRALHDRWLGEGRGWPASGGFGFRRNTLTKYLEIDPEQWPFIELIFYSYLESRAEGGVRRVVQLLKEADCKLSSARVYQILKSPIYVTGEYCVRKRGQLIACEPIDLQGRGIPLDVFQRVQELLTVRTGKSTRHPDGTFILNHACYCGTCGRRLRARAVKGNQQTTGYYHDSPVPPACHGKTFDTKLVEPAVVRELLRLASCRELQEAWAARVEVDFADGEPLLTNGQISEFKRRIELLEDSKRRIMREFNERLISGDVSGSPEATFWQMVSGVDNEIDELRRKLERAQTLNEVREAMLARRSQTNELLDSLRETLTEHVPDDDAHRTKRAAIVKAMLSKVVLTEKDGFVSIELHGPLIPDDATVVRAYDVVAHAMEAATPEPMTAEEAEIAGLLKEITVKASPGVDRRAVGGTLTLRTDREVSPYETVRGMPIEPLTEKKPRSRREIGIRMRLAWKSPRLPVGTQRRTWSSGYSEATLRRVAELIASGMRNADCVRALQSENVVSTRGHRYWDQRSLADAAFSALEGLDLDTETRRALADRLRGWKSYVIGRPNRRPPLAAVEAKWGLSGVDEEAAV